MKRGVLVVAALMCMTPAKAQETAISREVKTISVDATEAVRVNPDLAIVTLSYSNRAETKEQAFRENVRAAKQIVDALLRIVPEENIETSRVSIQIDMEDEPSPDRARKRWFSASQTWKVRTPAGDAQRITELAIRSGANELDDVEWAVADPNALESQALAAALDKAHTIAETMAKRMNLKLGELQNMRNSGSEERFTQMYWMRRDPGISDETDVQLRIFPKKIEVKATVHAVFALQ